MIQGVFILRNMYNTYLIDEKGHGQNKDSLTDFMPSNYSSTSCNFLGIDSTDDCGR